jgi:acetoin utilization protein AcuC
MKTALIYHSDFRKYDFGPNHPLRGDRYAALREIFSSESIRQSTSELTFVKPNPAAYELIKLVHGEQYLDLLSKLNSEGGFLSADTPIYPGLYDIAKLLAGAGILAGRLVVNGIFQRAIVLGGGAHHAGFDFGGGFCLINDIAVMVKYLRSFYAQERIAVLDLDAHCGNGTIDIFYEDSSVLCVDFHEDPLYLFPGTGFAEQIGLKEGKGYTVNIPFPRGSGDQHYINAFKELCIPIITEFNPQLIIVFGGIDAHFADPLSHLQISLKGFSYIMRLISELSGTICNGRMIVILGTSYNPKILPLAWQVLINATLDKENIVINEPYEMPKEVEGVNELVQGMLSSVKNIHKRYWRSL